MFHTSARSIRRMTGQDIENARNEARRNVGALDNALIANHLLLAAEGTRHYDSIDRFALLYVAAARLRATL